MVRSERFAVVAVTTGWGRDRLAVLAQAVDVQDDRLADEAFHLVDRAGRNADTRQFGRVGSVTGHAPLDDHRVTGHVIIPSDPPANGVGEREDGHDTPVDSMPVLAGTAEGIVDDRRPLAGITVLVPRAREQAGAFSLLLRQRGAEPLEVPTIAIRRLRWRGRGWRRSARRRRRRCGSGASPRTWCPRSRPRWRSARRSRLARVRCCWPGRTSPARSSARSCGARATARTTWPPTGRCRWTAWRRAPAGAWTAARWTGWRSRPRPRSRGSRAPMAGRRPAGSGSP